MSVHRYETADGTRFRVRWRTADGTLRSKTLLSAKDARNFDADVKTRKLRLEALPSPTDWTLNSAWEEWKASRGGEVAVATLDNYQSLWSAYVEPSFGHMKLAHLVAEPMLIEKFNSDLREGYPGEDGEPTAKKVGASSRRKLLMVMSGVLRACVAWGKIPMNPVRDIPKPSAAPSRTGRVFSPVLIERIRGSLLSRRAAPSVEEWRPEADACLVTLMAYSGLRPQEALALRFEDMTDKRISIERALSDAPIPDADGKRNRRRWTVGPTKTRGGRKVPLADAVRDDLNGLRQAMGNPAGGTFVFPGTHGRPWSKSSYSNWRSRVWRPAVEAIASTDPDLAWLSESRPYDCRRSFVSLQLRAGVPPLEVAADAGHSAQVMFRHYSTVIEDLIGEPQLSADEQIALARKLVRESAGEFLRKVTSESLKPPKEASPQYRNLLYEPHDSSRLNELRRRRKAAEREK